MPDLGTFYSTMAQVSFTLLGLWWVVVQFKHSEWMARRRQRQMAYHTSLFFLLPGVMSLIALVSLTSHVIWRVAFTSAAVFGLIASILVLTSSKEDERKSPAIKAAHAIGLVFYVLLIAVALVPTLPADLRIHLTGLQAEATLLAVMLFLGVNTTWLQFARLANG